MLLGCLPDSWRGCGCVLSQGRQGCWLASQCSGWQGRLHQIWSEHTGWLPWIHIHHAVPVNDNVTPKCKLPTCYHMSLNTANRTFQNIISHYFESNDDFGSTPIVNLHTHLYLCTTNSLTARVGILKERREKCYDIGSGLHKFRIISYPHSKFF